MKRLIFVTGIILISCVCISVLASPQAIAETGVTASTEQQPVENKSFVIKSENGRIVVYRKGESSPFMTTDTFTDTLPRSDLMKLENGIEVEGNAQLRKTLEDYCS